MRNNLISKFIITLTLVAFLTFSVGKVNRVFALADPVDIAPIYETTVYQFQDYVENTLTESQGDIFYIMLGMYLAAQAGSSQYELYNPHTSEGGLLNWLKDCGIQLYNSVILKAAQPDLVLGQDIRPAMSALVAYYMGVAVKASKYSTVQDFLDDVNVSEKYCLTLTPDSMFNMNLLFQSYGGLGQWQYTVTDFTTQATYITYGGVPQSLQTQYYTNLNSVSDMPIIRYNDTSSPIIANGRIRGALFSQYHNLFINIVDHKYYFYDDLGNPMTYYESSSSRFSNVYAETYQNPPTSVHSGTKLTSRILASKSITDFANFVSFQDMTQAIFNGVYRGNIALLFYEDFVQHVYYGSDWASKHEIFNTSDLDLVDLANPYFLQPTQEILLDIKGLLNDLLNTTDLHDPFVNNIYLPDYSPYNIDDLIKVSVDAIIQAVADPPIPVDLNEIAEYTENDYLDQLKEHAHDFSDTIGSYVAFWHNVDFELVYTVLGGVIIVMIGAFIGKWGHS